MYELKNVHHFTPQDMDDVILLWNNHWFEQHQAFPKFVHQCLIMFSEIMILLRLARLAISMIGLFLLVLIMFMIYLFRNLIKQLPNYST